MTACKICESSDLLSIFRHDYLSFYSLNYLYNRKEAVAATSASVDFVRCLNSGFLFNQTCQQLNYNVDYESGRGHSTTFKNYIREVACLLFSALDQNVKQS